MTSRLREIAYDGKRHARAMARGTARATVAVADAVEARIGRPAGFVVVGTGRCGTTYVSEALTASGLACGHEQMFTPAGPRRSLRLAGDASWLAVPYLDDVDAPVYHVVREPLAVVNSFLAIGFFRLGSAGPVGAGGHHRRHQRFAQRHFGFSGDEVADAVRWYVEWNRRCERFADHRFRIEDARAGVALILERQHPDGLAHLDAALAAMSPKVNSLDHIKAEVPENRLIGADDLPDTALVDELRAMARRYGYPL
jgi:hypothetical protein